MRKWNPKIYRDLRAVTVLFVAVGIAVACDNTFDGAFEEPTVPTTVTSANLTFDNSAISGSFDDGPSEDSRVVTCAFTYFDGEQELLAKRVDPAVNLRFLTPEVTGASASVSITELDQNEFQTRYLVQDTNLQSVRFNCRGEVAEAQQVKVEEDEVRFFKLVSLLGSVRGGNTLELRTLGSTAPDSLGLVNPSDKPALSLEVVDPEPVWELVDTLVPRATCSSEKWDYFFDGTSLVRGKSGSSLFRRFAGSPAIGGFLNNRLLLNIREFLKGFGSAQSFLPTIECSDSGATLWYALNPAQNRKIVGVHFLVSTILFTSSELDLGSDARVLQFPAEDTPVSEKYFVVQDTTGVFKVKLSGSKFDQISLATVNASVDALDAVLPTVSSSGFAGHSHSKFVGSNQGGYYFMKASVHQTCADLTQCQDRASLNLDLVTIGLDGAGTTRSIRSQVVLSEYSADISEDSVVLKNMILRRERNRLFEGALHNILEQVLFGLSDSSKVFLKQFGQYFLDAETSVMFVLQNEQVKHQKILPQGPISEVFGVVIELDHLAPGYAGLSFGETYFLSFIGSGKVHSQQAGLVDAANNILPQKYLNTVYDFATDKVEYRHEKDFVDSLSAALSGSKYIVEDNERARENKYQFEGTQVAVSPSGEVVLGVDFFPTGSLLSDGAFVGYFNVENQTLAPTAEMVSPASGLVDIDWFLFDSSLDVSDLSSPNQLLINNRLSQLKNLVPSCPEKQSLNSLRSGDGYLHLWGDCGSSRYVFSIDKSETIFSYELDSSITVFNATSDSDRLVLYTEFPDPAADFDSIFHLRVIDKASSALSQSEVSRGGNNIESMGLAGNLVYILDQKLIEVVEITTQGLAEPKVFFGDVSADIKSGCSLSSYSFRAEDVKSASNNMSRFCDGAVLAMHLSPKSPEGINHLTVLQVIAGHLNLMDIQISSFKP